MYLLVLLIPITSATITGFFGKFLGKNGAKLINFFSMLLTFLISTLILYEVAFLKYTCLVDLGSWFRLGSISVNYELLFDTITAVMLFAVSLVSLLVHIYSYDYMGGDPHFIRFITYLTLFTFFMFVLLTAGNLVQIFAGWEGVGLASYLLINFWFTRTQANTSALKAVLINRFGDFSLYTGIALAFYLFKSVNLFNIFSLAPIFIEHSTEFFGWSFSTIELICFFIFLGAVGKSAQVGLHVWLPDAMEGPTPVSALIHAATMVTAGIFVVIRCSPLFEFAPHVLGFVTIVGALTAFFAATIGLVQNDLKKIIAYSTCSQLGYMVFACGTSNYSAGFFHLVNHAFFKALLFLCAGSVIHALSNEQDIRKMGGLAAILPITYTMMLIGSLSLLGFPYLTGFYSKDVILELTFSNYSISALFAYFLGISSVCLTAFYSLRLLHLTFFSSSSNSIRSIVEHAHESPLYMLIAFVPLALGSIFWGYLAKDIFIGMGSDFWQTSIYLLPQNYTLVEAEFLPLNIKILPFLLSMLGVSLSFIIYYVLNTVSIIQITKNFSIFVKIYRFLSKKWYVDLIYNQYMARFYFFISYHITFKWIDRGLVEFFGPLGIVRTSDKIAINVSKLHSGFLYQYIFLSILFFTSLAFLYFLEISSGTYLDVLILGNLFLTISSLLVINNKQSNINNN